MKCLICNNAEMICTKKPHHYTESGLDNIYLEGIDVCECPSCGEEIVNIPAVPELHSLVGRHIVKKKSPLNGREVRFLRKNAGLTAKRLSTMIGIDAATISRWENGVQSLAPSNDRLIRLIYSGIKGVPGEDTKHLIEKDFEAIENDVASDVTPFHFPPGAWCKLKECLA